MHLFVFLFSFVCVKCVFYCSCAVWWFIACVYICLSLSALWQTVHLYPVSHPLTPWNRLQHPCEWRDELLRTNTRGRHMITVLQHMAAYVEHSVMILRRITVISVTVIWNCDTEFIISFFFTCFTKGNLTVEIQQMFHFHFETYWNCNLLILTHYFHANGNAFYYYYYYGLSFVL